MKFSYSFNYCQIFLNRIQKYQNFKSILINLISFKLFDKKYYLNFMTILKSIFPNL
jgi:hypothetical protein